MNEWVNTKVVNAAKPLKAAHFPFPRAKELFEALSCSDDHFMGAYATLYGGTAGYSPLTAPNYRYNFDQRILLDMFEKTNEKKGTSVR